MGSCGEPSSTKQPSNLCKIVTLNYSGILLSPYQFFNSRIDKRIFDIFMQEALLVNPSFNRPQFSWRMGSLDAKWLNRFSPLYKIDCGVKIQSQTMMNEDEFKIVWDQCLKDCEQQIIESYFKVKYDNSTMEQKIYEQINNCKKFDLCCYRSLVKQIYGLKDLENINDLSSRKYLKVRKQHFEQNFLKKQKKINMFIEGVVQKSYDIICLQEVDSYALQILSKNPQFIVVSSGDPQNTSKILLKKQKFKVYNLEEQNKKFLEQWSKAQEIPINDLIKRINYDNDSCFQAIGNFVVICVHLSSKPQKNKYQIQQVLQEYKNLAVKLSNHKFIFVGDFNGNLKKGVNPEDYYLFPNCSRDVTCCKKRTVMQVQTKKANIINAEIQLTNCAITLIDGTPVFQNSLQRSRNSKIDYIIKNKFLLPCDSHPFDHFAVAANFQL